MDTRHWLVENVMNSPMDPMVNHLEYNKNLNLITFEMISIIMISIIFNNNTTFFLHVIIRYDKCQLSPGSQNVQWSSQVVLRKPYVILRTLLDPRPVARNHGTNGVTTRTCFWYFYILYIVYHWIGLGEHWQETSIFNGKNHGFLSIFPTKPIQWVSIPVPKSALKLVCRVCLQWQMLPIASKCYFNKEEVRMIDDNFAD